MELLFPIFCFCFEFFFDQWKLGLEEKIDFVQSNLPSFLLHLLR